MKISGTAVSVLIATSLVLSACSILGNSIRNDNPVIPGTGETMNQKNEDSMMDGEKPMDENSGDDMMDEGENSMEMEKPKDSGETDGMNEEKSTNEPEVMMEMPGWFSTELINVRTGESFTLSDHQGKVILVENMAIWCSTCFRQQQQVKALHRLLGDRDDFISLGLDIDPNENSDDLMDYIDSNGFDWVYAVAPIEVTREIGDLYGSEYINPPSAPMLIVDQHGNVHPLESGVKTAEDLKAVLENYLVEDM